MKKMLVLLILLLPSVCFAGTAEDIAAMDAGDWYEVASSDLESYASFNANGVACSTSFAWSGGAFDSAGNRMIVWGGGHGDCRDNTVYAFDLDDYAWAIAKAQSSKAVIDACFACSFDCSTGLLSDGNPVARHTYAHLAYHPTWNALVSALVKAPSSESTCYSNVDKYNLDYMDFDTGSWVTGNAQSDSAGNDRNIGTVTVDSSGNIWLLTSDTSANWDLYEYKYSNSTWYKRYDNHAFYVTHPMGAIDTDNDIMFSVGSSLEAVWDLSDETDPTILTTTITGDDAAYANGEHLGLTWDSDTGLFVGWAGDAGDTTAVYVFNLDSVTSTYHCVKVAAAAGNTVTPPTALYTYGRWGYSPDNDVFVLPALEDDNVHIYKLTDVPGDTTLPIVTEFNVPATSASNTVTISTFTATDDDRVMGYQVTDSPIPPLPAWSSAWTYNAVPSTYTVPRAGKYDLYAWVHDMHGNISRFAVDTVEVNCTHVYVDADITDCTNYNPTTELCSGGSDRAYDTITEAVAYVNTNNSATSSYIIEIDPDDTWTGSVDSETNPAGVCYGLSDDFTNIPIVVNYIGQATIKGKDDDYAVIQWLCRDPEDYAYCWGPGDPEHHSIITMSNAEGNEPYLRVEYLDISGATSNGAGIWIEASVGDLYAKNCKFHYNDNGILTSADTGIDVTVLYSEFYHNSKWYGEGGQEHNIYVGENGTFIFMGNHSYDAYRGQLVKSRAETTYILYNRLTDENTGLCATESYCVNYPIDLPFGGKSYVVGNIVSKNNKCYNDTFINYGREVKLDIDYNHGGTAELTDSTVVTNSRTSHEWTVRYNYNSGATGTWAGHDRASHCDFSIVESDNHDFEVGDRLTYSGGASYIDVTSVDWTWAGTDHDIFVYNNTFINECELGYDQWLLRAHIDTTIAKAQNNIIIDLGVGEELEIDASGVISEKAVTEVTDYWGTADPGFTAIGSYDFSLTSGGAATVGTGTAQGVDSEVFSLIPIYEYDGTSGVVDRDSADYKGAVEYEGESSPLTIQGCTISGGTVQ